MDSSPVLLNWKAELPPVEGHVVTLREPSLLDVGPLVDLLSLDDASRFGLDEPITESLVRDFVERALRHRSAGISFSYAILSGPARTLAGLIQVRQLDPAFETSEWECTLAPSARGSGAFLDAAKLAGTFAFERVGTHRIEARVPLQNGRANSALRKLGAVQDGVLRRSLRRGHEYLDQVLWAVLKEDWGSRWDPVTPRVH